MNYRLNTLPLVAFAVSLLLPACGLGRKKIPKGGPDGRAIGGAESAEVMSPDSPYVVPRSAVSGLKGTIGIGDTIELNVYEGVRTTDTLLKKALSVDPAGQIQLPKIGAVSVSGLTVGAAIQSIESSYRRADWSAGLRSTAHISSWNGRPLVLIDGSVRQPGAYATSDTLASAVAAAGGAKTTSNYIYCIRDGVRTTVSAEDASTFVLEAGDIIRVPLGF